MPDRPPLRFMARLEFAARHFPQALCPGCPHLPVCTDLLGRARPWEFWLVRGEGECARAFPASNPPPDMTALKGRLIALIRQHLPTKPARR